MSTTRLLAIFALAAALSAGAALAHEKSHGQEAGRQAPAVEVTPERVKAGRAIFLRNCRTCHRPDSDKTLIGPGLKGLFQMERTPAMGHPVTEENIRGHIHQGGGKMPAFPGIEGQDMAELLAYLKSL